MRRVTVVSTCRTGPWQRLHRRRSARAAGLHRLSSAPDPRRSQRTSAAEHSTSPLARTCHTRPGRSGRRPDPSCDVLPFGRSGRSLLVGKSRICRPRATSRRSLSLPRPPPRLTPAPAAASARPLLKRSAQIRHLIWGKRSNW